MKTLVKDVMTTRVIWVRKDASFRELAAALRANRVSAFPVLDEQDRVIGIVSEADLLTKEALDGEPVAFAGLLHRREQQKARGITAGDLMTAPAVTVAPEDLIEHAARLMYTRKVKRLPVTDADGHLAGILSRTDVLSVFDRPDGDIAKEITGEVIRDEFLLEPADVTVTVKDGIVTLAGVAPTLAVGLELVQRVRHVQGVVAVRDRLGYPAAQKGR